MKKVLVLLMALSGFNAFAEGQGVGNGGDAYLIGTKYYSFDLVEKGMENDVSIDPTLALDPETMAAINEKISPKQIFPRNEFARKMTELKKILPAYHYILLNVFKHYNWIFVNATLTDVNDVSSVISIDTSKMAQAAVRYGGEITIDRSIFTKMPATNQVALIMHELNYAIQKFGDRNSNSTRRIVRKIFDPSQTAEDLSSSLDIHIHYENTVSDNGDNYFAYFHYVELGTSYRGLVEEVKTYYGYEEGYHSSRVLKTQTFYPASNDLAYLDTKNPPKIYIKRDHNYSYHYNLQVRYYYRTGDVIEHNEFERNDKIIKY